MKTIKYIYISIIILTIYSCSWKVGIITDDGDSKYYASNKAKKSMLQNDTSVKVDKLNNGITYYIKNKTYP